MMVLITYDVETMTKAGQRRLQRIAKVCQDYGQRVQNSVFECIVNESQIVILKRKIEEIMDKKTDNIRFYYLGNNWQRHIDSLGKLTTFDYTQELII